MFSSSTFNNSTTTTSPIFYVDNIVSYLIDDESTNYSTSYYHIPSPFLYNEIDNYGGFITNNHDELTLLQQSILASNNINDNNNNNNNSSIDHTDDSSIFEVDNKVDCSNKGRSGDHHEVEVNGIVDDNGEMNHHNISSTTTTTTTNTTNNSHHHGLIMKKKRRTSNKDRHSKIRTAHGLRDRRMRLSLQVARPFFKLQDLLGFDKASTTVEWLLMQSKPAIDELIQVKHGSSPSSGVTTTTNKCNTPISSNSDDYCDVESTTNEDREGDHNNNSMRKRVMKDEPKQKEMKRKRTTKEERKVARERAKKRTLERMQTRGNNHPFTSLTNYQKNVPNYLISTQHNTMRGPQ